MPNTTLQCYQAVCSPLPALPPPSVLHSTQQCYSFVCSGPVHAEATAIRGTLFGETAKDDHPAQEKSPALSAPASTTGTSAADTIPHINEQQAATSGEPDIPHSLDSRQHTSRKDQAVEHGMHRSTPPPSTSQQEEAGQVASVNSPASASTQRHTGGTLQPVDLLTCSLWQPNGQPNKCSGDAGGSSIGALPAHEHEAGAAYTEPLFQADLEAVLPFA